MDFLTLSDTLEKLEKANSRNKMTELLAGLFEDLSSDEIQITVYMLLGTLSPSFDPILLNVAEKMNLEAIAKAYGVELSEAKKLYKQKGDQGEVASALSKNKKSSVSIKVVYKGLVEIARYEGKDSVSRKIDALSALYKGLDKKSVRYVARLPVGKLRLGFSDKTVIDALSYLVAGDKSVKGEIEKAYEVRPDVGLIAKTVKTKGVEGLSRIKPEVGVPVMPMLAQRLKSPSEMIKKMGEVSVEPKFDGLRVLVHFKRKKLLKAYTRNLNDVTEMFPELETISKYTKAKSLILDTEAVGMDPKTKKMVDFQKTISRRRKHEIAESAKGTPIRFAVFDLVYKDGKSLMGKTYEERREALEKIFKKNNYFVVDERTVTSSPKEISEKHEKYLAEGLEGVIVKRNDSTYVPGRTGWRWVKMKEKEDAHGRLSDTVDALIMGYTRGRGKRAEFGIGQFLAGVGKGDGFVTLTKVGTGMSDEQFRELAKRLKKIRLGKKPKEYEVHSDLEPDYWVSPKVVVELAGDALTKSPKHTAGYALRFPRLIKFRDDKDKGQVTSLRELKNLYREQ